MHALGEDVEVLVAQSVQVEGDAFEAGHAGVAGRVRFGDVEQEAAKSSSPVAAPTWKNNPFSTATLAVAAALFCTLQDRPQRVPCCGHVAAAGGEPAAHNGDARVTDGLVGVGEHVGEPQLGRGDLSLAAQQRDRAVRTVIASRRCRLVPTGGPARLACERRRRRRRGARD